MKPSTKILFIIDTLSTGGAEKSMIDIVSHMSRFQIFFIEVYESKNSLQREALPEGIAIFKLGIKNKYKFSTAAKRIQDIIDQIQPNIIHSTLIRSDFISRLLKNQNNIPIVNSFVSNSYSDFRYRSLGFVRKVKLLFVQLLDRKSVRKVDLFISNSNIIKESNANVLKIPLDKIIVIPRGRDITKFQFSDPEKGLFLHENNWEGLNLIVNVGRLIKSKGQDDLIQSFETIARQDKTAYLLIAGEGPYRKSLESLIRKKNLEDRVCLLGNRWDIPKILAVAKIFVFPSYLEGMPGSVIEAMMAKAPIICSNIPENVECFPKDRGKFVSPGDIKGLAKAMEQILYSPEKNSEIEELYHYALTNFDIRRIAERYENVYFKLINQYYGNSSFNTKTSTTRS